MADDSTDKVNSIELYFAAFGPTLFVKNHMTALRIPDRPYIQIYSIIAATSKFAN
jgi:hypothetical protein